MIASVILMPSPDSGYDLAMNKSSGLKCGRVCMLMLWLGSESPVLTDDTYRTEINSQIECFSKLLNFSDRPSLLLYIV